MLCVPVRNHSDRVVAVIQVINRCEFGGALGHDLVPGLSDAKLEQVKEALRRFDSMRSISVPEEGGSPIRTSSDSDAQADPANLLGGTITEVEEDDEADGAESQDNKSEGDDMDETYGRKSSNLTDDLGGELRLVSDLSEDLRLDMRPTRSGRVTAKVPFGGWESNSVHDSAVGFNDGSSIVP